LNKETHEKANDILIYIVNLLDYNSKIHSINFYDYSSVKITCLFMKLNLDFLNISTTENDEILLDSLINIQQEIEQLEIFNYTNINNNSNFENIDSGMANVNIILNQLPILKCYLIHWNLLLFVKISQDGDQDNLQPLETQFSNNLLRNIEKYLELVCNQEYFKNLKNFEYIVKFVCIFFLISKKEKYKNRILELSSDFLNKLEVCQFIDNLYGEFDLNTLIEQREKLIEDVANDCFLKSIIQEFKQSTSNMILQLYINLYNKIEISKFAKMDFCGYNDNLEEYISLLIKNKYSGVKIEVIEENGQRIITYSFTFDNETNEHMLKTKIIKNISDKIWSHLETY